MSAKAGKTKKAPLSVDPAVREEREKTAWLNFLLQQSKKENDQLKEANERLSKAVKFNELQLTTKDQDIKDLQGELARRFLTTKESLMDKIGALQMEVTMLEKRLRVKSDEADQLQREADRAKVQSERQLVEKDKTIEKLLLYSEQMVDDFVTKILPKLNTVHKIECAPDKSRRDQLEIWLQSFRRDMLLLQ